MGSSFYIQIASYLLLEYTYGGTDTTYISSQVKLAKIKNNHFDGQIQFLNNSASLNTTKNVLNTSAIRIGNSKWAYLNTDVPTPYLNTDSDIVFTDLSSTLPSTYVLYDRVRVHILSGYRMEDLDGLIVQIYGKESQTSLASVLANTVYLNSDSSDILNPKPILLGDRMYDRYIEVYIPSIKNINQDYYSNPANELSLGYQYTSTHGGLSYNTAIYVKVHEILSSETRNGNIFFNTSNEYEVAVNQEDRYSSLAAVITEADDGDYFKYYPSYDGNYIEDFLTDLNSAGGNYALINDIEVIEQIGLETISTFSFSQLQVSGFDEPITWRPIIKYSDSAVSFSIDYTVRLYNRENGFQIIRRASTTCFNPKKYGKSLQRIGLDVQSYPLKVYNKVVSGPSVSFSNQDYNTNFKTVYIPVFYDSKQVIVQTKSLVTPVGDNATEEETYFGQGDARIYISDFDTYLKFNVHRMDKKTNALTHMDLTKGDISIVFKDKIGKKIVVPLDSSITQNSRVLGELLFTIPGELKKKVLYDSFPKNFEIVVESEGTSPTIIYSGSVVGNEKISEEPTRVKQIQTTSSSLTSTLSSSSGASATATNTISGRPAYTTATGKPSYNTSLLTDLIKTDSQSLGTKDKIEVLQPHIPGYSNDFNAVSVKNGVRPKKAYSDKSAESQLAKADGTTVPTVNSPNSTSSSQ